MSDANRTYDEDAAAANEEQGGAMPMPHAGDGPHDTGEGALPMPHGETRPAPEKARGDDADAEPDDPSDDDVDVDPDIALR